MLFHFIDGRMRYEGQIIGSTPHPDIVLIEHPWFPDGLTVWIDWDRDNYYMVCPD